MAILSAAELADLKSEQELAFIQTCVIKRATSPGADDYGQPQPKAWGNPTTVYSGVCGYLDKLSGKDGLNRDTNRYVVLGVPTLLVPLGTDVAIEDRVYSITSSTGAAIESGRIFKVTRFFKKETHILLELELVTG